MVLCKEIPNVLGNAEKPAPIDQFLRFSLLTRQGLPHPYESIDLRIRRFQYGSETHRMGYRWKAGSEMRTMAVSLGRSDVPGAQHGALTESPGSRDVSGSFFAPKPTKNRIRSYPMGRAVITRSYGDIFGVFTGFGGHPGCLSAYLRQVA